MKFNNNIYWNDYLHDIANKWSWQFFMYFKANGENKLEQEDSDIIRDRIYSIGQLPTKELQVINSYQGGIRMTHPSRSYYENDLVCEFYEDTLFNVSRIFKHLMDGMFANYTILNEDYPYKEDSSEIDYMEIKFYKPSDGKNYTTFKFHKCWVKEFEYINNLETRNEEEMLKCRAVIKYNYYEVI